MGLTRIRSINPLVNAKLRYFEYYNMQNNFDWLYNRSKENRMNGIDLYKIIISENNILLAYRMIKSNTGSKTVGVDKEKISDFRIKDKDEFVKEIRMALLSYQPQSVRRVEIPKPNGEKRSLGIPTMKDRIIQQMFKQVLEPICEAKFYKHSYGFRPNRSAHHAIARCMFLMNKSTFHHVIDIDIQGFFDNVNHSKLLSQLYSIGIKDKRVLTIVSKMLKAPIYKKGTPQKGTPQGGILSPLLSNVVLNDLDWWIASQWECFPTKHSYTFRNKIPALKKSNLKEMYIVRYADDFKIFTKNHKIALKVFHAVKEYLKNQLKLEISIKKSKITNLRKRQSEFLGFEMKVVKKKKVFVAKTGTSKKNKNKIQNKIKLYLKELRKSPSWQNATSYNAYVLGIHNYYRIATQVNLDFSKITYLLSYAQYNHLKNVAKYEVPRSPPKSYSKIYKNRMRTYKIGNIYLFPLADIKWELCRNFSQEICDYTINGRIEGFKRLSSSISDEIQKMQKSITSYRNLEFADNRISRYSMQSGKCAVLGRFLEASDAHCHHILPRYIGGTDEFSNLVIIHKCVHKIIHSNNPQMIEQYRHMLKLNKKELEKINKYRKKCNLFSI